VELQVTFYDVWLDQPEHPAAFFPEGRATFFLVKEGIESGRFRGEHADHLVWQAQMTRAEIEELVREVFGPDGADEARHAGPLERLADRMRALRTAVAALPEEELVTVGANEY
jgi:hypothetical protein